MPVSPEQVRLDLNRIESDPDFASRSEELVDRWEAAGAGAELVEPVLGFMEVHPLIDFGSPGRLVHCVERFRGSGYEERLLASIASCPVPITVWMLNRLINGTQDPVLRARYVTAMGSVCDSSRAHVGTQADARHFMERLKR